jgi:hypothetical protein
MLSLFITEELEWLIQTHDLIRLKDAVYAILHRVSAFKSGELATCS